eukprot:3831770-Alexandrium_andersonii.AAC.1
MARRLANICRAVAQGCLKNPKCEWVRALPWSQQEAPPTKKSRASSSAAAGPPATAASEAGASWIYGFDSDSFL